MSGAFAVYVIMTRRLRTEELRTNLFYTGAGVFVPLTVYVPRVWLTPSPHDLAVFVAIGVFGFFALLTLDRAVERAEVSTSISFVYLQLVFAAAISWRRQPHPITAQLLGGAALIAAAAALRWRQLAARAPAPLGATQGSP
jgi:drug/metabolite transporter (DMT)-like permease